MRLIFSTPSTAGKYLKNHGIRGLAWLCCRHPKVAYQILGVSLMALLVGRRCHVMIESQQKVLDPRFLDVRVYGPEGLPSSGYSIIGSIEVLPNAPLDDPVRLKKTKSLTAITATYLTLWATGGKVRLFGNDDCVMIAKRHLRYVGVHVPDSIWTPQQLIDWLCRNGYTFTPA